jgi:hypothetical protein
MPPIAQLQVLPSVRADVERSPTARRGVGYQPYPCGAEKIFGIVCPVICVMFRGPTPAATVGGTIMCGPPGW